MLVELGELWSVGVQGGLPGHVQLQGVCRRRETVVEVSAESGKLQPLA